MQRASVWDDAASRSHTELGTGRYAWMWLLAIAIAWWAVTQRQFTDAGFEEALAGLSEIPRAPLAVLAIASVAGRAFGLLIEAAFYWAWWRSWGAPFRLGRFFVAIATCSLLDACALTLKLMAADQSDTVVMLLAPIAGWDLLREGPVTSAPSLDIAFGGFSLAIVARLVLTALAQARETGRGFAMPLVLTSLAWTACRLVTWWSLDLARGASGVR